MAKRYQCIRSLCLMLCPTNDPIIPPEISTSHVWQGASVLCPGSEEREVFERCLVLFAQRMTVGNTNAVQYIELSDSIPSTDIYSSREGT